LLYSVKVKINEPVRQALALSTESRAAFHKSIAETRLEEAEVLAAEGRLNADAGAQIEESLDRHLAEAEEITKELEEEEQDELAAEFSAELDSALSAHGSILTKLGEHSEDKETKERGTALASRITSRVFAKANTGAGATFAAKMAGPSAEVSLMATEAADTSSFAVMESDNSDEAEEESEANKQAALQLEAKAENALAEAREVFGDLEESLDATTTARVEAQFETLDEQIAAGKDLYEAGEYKAARATFGATIRDITELHVYLRAEQRFNKKFLRSWVDDRFGSWFEARKEDRPRESDEGSNDEEERDSNDEREDKEDADTDEGGDDSDSRVEVKVDLGL